MRYKYCPKCKKRMRLIQKSVMYNSLTKSDWTYTTYHCKTCREYHLSQSTSNTFFTRPISET